MAYNIYLGNNQVDNAYLGETEITDMAILGSLLNQIPDGIYMIDEEGSFICEEENTEILLIEETEA